MANLIHRRESRGEAMTPRPTLRGGGWDPLRMVSDLLRWDPFREVGLPVTGGELAFMPDFEVKETQDAYVFRADLPGVKEQDIEISLTGNRVTVSGKREDEDRQEGDTYYAYERTYGTFSRSFTLPEGVNIDGAKAEVKDGVLTLSVPKRAEVKSRKISLGKGDGGKEKGESKQIKA